MNTEKIPADFRYKDVLEKGPPAHEDTDPFWIKHPSMPCARRAKIFAPFDALRGFNDTVKAKETLYVEKHNLSECELDDLDRIVAELRKLTYNSRASRENAVTVLITYFELCRNKDSEAYLKAGIYKTISGICYGVFPDRTIRVDEHVIHLDEICKIEYTLSN